MLVANGHAGEDGFHRHGGFDVFQAQTLALVLDHGAGFERGGLSFDADAWNGGVDDEGSGASLDGGGGSVVGRGGYTSG